jgi:hypothetical protein
MNDLDPIAQALAKLDTPALDPDFAKRVGAVAKLELRAPAAGSRSTSHWMPALRGALVPALLTIAAIAQTATTVSTVSKIYGHSHIVPAQ